MQTFRKRRAGLTATAGLSCFGTRVEAEQEEEEDEFYASVNCNRLLFVRELRCIWPLAWYHKYTPGWWIRRRTVKLSTLTYWAAVYRARDAVWIRGITFSRSRNQSVSQLVYELRKCYTVGLSELFHRYKRVVTISKYTVDAVEQVIIKSRKVAASDSAVYNVQILSVCTQWRVIDEMPSLFSQQLQFMLDCLF